jgi:hypothetical protein
MEQKNIEQRIFSMTDRNCPEQLTGGAGGVNYRLLLANKNYNLIQNMYHIFSDVVVEEDAMMNLVMLSNQSMSDGERLIKYYKKLNEYYWFTDNDIYFFHDVMSAYVFVSIFNVHKTVLIYHQQGSLYAEWVCFQKQHNETYRKELNERFAYVVNAVKYLAFPSKGAMQSVIDSEPALEEVIIMQILKFCIMVVIIRIMWILLRML